MSVSSRKIKTLQLYNRGGKNYIIQYINYFNALSCILSIIGAACKNLLQYLNLQIYGISQNVKFKQIV